MTRAALRVAVLGAGTVGGEVIRALRDSDERLAAADGCRLDLVAIGVREVETARGRGLPADLLSDAPAHLVASADNDVIVELMGGDEPAHTLVTAALSAGKAVVTANKHVIAHHGAELERAARRSAAALRFEAAVGGGIPILGTLAADLSVNRIERVRGILNGTTNYILSAMADGVGTYEAVLRDAQQRGYAEADPSGDVEGRDAINKLVILARLAFGTWLDPASVPDRPPSLRGAGGPGITGVTADELAGAAALGLALRLVAVAELRRDGKIAASVVPTAVPADSPLGRTGGVRNRIEVRGEPVGDVGFDGPGAGGPATSSAVLADLVAIARGQGSTWAGRPPAAPGGDAADGIGDATLRWFAFLRGAKPGHLPDGLAEAEAPMRSGVAIRTPWLALETLRERLVDVAGGVDVLCFPIGD